jgi:hypothetical protein
MSNKSTETTLRDRYFSNEIFRIGDIVEDTKTGEQVKILDRGSNYLTVATSTGILKKWLNEVVEVTDDISTTPEQTPIVKVDEEFEILESGQIKLFGHETKNFDADLSELIIEQFSEFDDLYSKHQIIKCLDFAIQESDSDRMYDLLDKVDKFYTKQEMESPFIVEAMKNDIERRRIVEILAAVADIKPLESNYKTVTAAIKALREKYQTRKQWEVLWPFIKLARSAGIMGITQNLPYNFDTTTIHEETHTDDIIIEALEDNLDLLVDDLDYDDIYDAFDECEFIDEGLSLETRNKLSIKLRHRSPILAVRRERAMSHSASSSVIMQRARRLAETMLKNRIFHKPAEDMTRQEKERFESGASKRKSLVARLAQKLVGKVRMLQSARMKHTNTPASPTHDTATSNIAAAGHGAS